MKLGELVLLRTPICGHLLSLERVLYFRVYVSVLCFTLLRFSEYWSGPHWKWPLCRGIKRVICLTPRFSSRHVVEGALVGTFQYPGYREMPVHNSRVVGNGING